MSISKNQIYNNIFNWEIDNKNLRLRRNRPLKQRNGYNEKLVDLPDDLYQILFQERP